ncbi:glutamine amidotransferase [Marinobacter sp. BGYM27]|uniref:glutamine amidotransferase n=1 Tax=Marinobacter sp. BGYM27 TaxID=2975597 RepID=UPI0021A8F137|nr:glutamine amidotransferase [Marinobacter sp. BGYM27]MDG5498575.1 glutamine amidotransferase [Marinobacter sp. BGYM27]
MKSLCIVKTGTTYPEIRDLHGDFDDWFISALSRPDLDVCVVDVTAGHPLPESPDGVVVTGSPAMVSDRAEWSEQTAAWLKAQVKMKTPVLGVCYGHQLLAHALGGRVDYHPGGREIGTLKVRKTDACQNDRLLRDLPDTFSANLTHMQSVLALPDGAELLAYSDHEPHQAFRYGDCAWGLQFHPEFSARIMTAYIQRLTDILNNENVDSAPLLAEVDATPDAHSLLGRFSMLVATQ